jgi:carbonic anhydrase/acetyltransferase-like protein (isoleucine patch superfamily)
MIYTIGDRKLEIRGQEYFIADNATVIGSVALEDKTSIWFNAVLRGDDALITIGEGSNVQDGSVLHSDPGLPLTLGSYVTIGHMVMLHGCTIGNNSLVGIGAVILNNAKIGNNCLVGAGSLIPEGKEYPDGSLILGTPGRVVRQLTPPELQIIRASAEHYIHNIKRYRNNLKPV